MRNQTLAVVISSMLMAAASQAQPAPTTDAASATTTVTPSSSNESLGSQDADQSNKGNDADRMNKSDASAMAQQRWREADTDRSGSLSQAEVQASMPNMAAKFSQMDANGDGQLSHEEMHNFKKSHKNAQWNLDMKTADTDNDGFLTLAEVQNGMPDVAPHFSTIDTDKDGKLSRQELAAHQRTVRSTGSDTSSSMDADTSTRTSTSTSTTTTETGVDAGNQSDTETTQGPDDTQGTSNR